MSRIGKMPIKLPAGVSVEILTEGAVRFASVKGPKGEVKQYLPELSSVEVTESEVIVTRAADNKKDKAQHGLVRALIQNGVTGVTDGFSKKLEINGVGFKVALEGADLVMSLGFSHPIKYPVPMDVKVEVEKLTITISGVNRQRVGQVAAEIREFKKPEPYKGKGIKYSDERVLRKAGKAGKA
jgi:large subunit ribosomal protein L6